jgi:HPt (histidine-containing phosphotransfer) domain-containing protein
MKPDLGPCNVVPEMSQSDEQELGPSKVKTAADASSGRSGDVSVGPHIPNPWRRTGLIDPDVLLAVCGEDEELLRQLCDDFKTYAPQRLAAVVDALRARDAADLREAAHKLRGVLSAFSSLGGDIAGEVEDLAASGKMEHAQPLVARLDSLMRDVLPQVDRLTLASLCGGAASRKA